MHRALACSVVLAAVSASCADLRDEETDPSSTVAQPTSDTPPDSTGVVDTSTSTTTGPDVTKLDVGAGTENNTMAEGGDNPGCDKVDFLFVIDNSGSMADEQINLIASFPSFITTIQDTLDEAQDYHLMVVDTDAWVYAQCPTICAIAQTCLVNPQYECGVTEPMECEDVLGAGVTFPRGAQATNADCSFGTGARYMNSDEADLSGTFECAARVGTGSTDDPEKPMESMVAAVTANTPASDCNEGFLRDDAILVVTFITDEDDAPADGSGGTVEGWTAALVAAKGGDPNAVVVLGLFGDGDQPGGICPPFNPDAASGAEPSPRLRQFVDVWGDRGVAGSVCAASYAPFFMEAVSVIDVTCDEFVPPAG